MPYNSTAELPDAVKKLPSHAQEIYMSAFNSAFKTYNGDEGRASAVAWTAVEQKYKKNAQGDWVAKEAKDFMEDLKTKYQNVLQEAGQRNQTENKRVKDFISSSLRALDESNEPLDDEAISKLITEADEVLNWLKAQEATKTDDGVGYPAEAYAYVPDSNKPSSWKLRLWEDPQKKVTRAQLGRAAAALSPGGFRGQRVEIPREDLASVKRKIRTEYRKLDVDDEDIPRWVKEAESRILVGDFTPLTEAQVTTKGKARVTVIKPGFNFSKDRFYPSEVLKRDYKMFEGVKMYANHPTDSEEKERPERSIRDWVATLKNVEPDSSGQLSGDAVIVEPWMQEKLALLRDKELLSEMGISINAVGTASKGSIDGTKTNVIERFVRVRSVDFVTEAGAGGGVQLYEAADGNILDVDLITLDSLKERRPDLVKSVEKETKSLIQEEVKTRMELEEKVQTLEEQVNNLTTENTDLKGQIQTAADDKAKAETAAKVKEAVDKATLPDPAKARILEKFKEATSDEGLEEAINSEAEYIAALTTPEKPKNLGDNNNPPKVNLEESFERLTGDPEQAKIAAKGR